MEFRVGHLGAGVLGNGVEGDVELHGGTCLRFEVAHELLLVDAAELEVVVEGDALLVEPMDEAVEEVVHFPADDRHRHLDLDVPGDRVDERAAVRVVDRVELALGEPASERRHELLDGLELSVLVHPRIGEFRERLLSHLGHEDLEGDLLAGAFTEARRELPVELDDVALRGPVDVLVEALDEHAGPDLVEQAVGIHLFDGLAILRPGEVQDHVVALGRRTIDFVHLGELLEHHRDLLVDLVVVDAGGLTRDLLADVLGGILQHRPEGDLDVDLEPFVRVPQGVEGRSCGRLEALRLEDLLDLPGKDLVDGFGSETLYADGGFNHLARRATGPEAGDLDLTSESARSGGLRLLQLGFGDQEGHHPLERCDLGDVDAHGGSFTPHMCEGRAMPDPLRVTDGSRTRDLRDHNPALYP